jgi:hypothetical protein
LSFRRSGTAAPAAPAVPQGKTPLALPPAPFEVSQEQVDEAAQRMKKAEAIEPPPAIELLARRVGLTPFERNLLLLCVAMEIDTRIGPLCARVHNDAALPFPTFALAFTIFENGEGQPHWDARSPDRPLLYWRLIESTSPRAVPFTTSALRADERIVNHVKGLAHLDDRIAPYVTQITDDAAGQNLPQSHGQLVDTVLQAFSNDSPQLRPVQLLGSDSDSKQLVARAAANQMGLTLYRLPADLLPTQATELETLARLWRRETFLLPLGLYLDAQDVDRSAEAHAAALKRFLTRGSGGVVFVDARETWPVPGGSLSLDVRKPEPGEQRVLWRQALGDGHDDAAAHLAAQFNLSSESITRIAAETHGAAGDEPLLDRLWSRATDHTRLHIDALAQRIDTKATWNDLVLPQAELDLLHQIVAHVTGRATVYDDWGFRERMNRGLGLSALFAGESGTGKTMAAEVIANELGVGLHRIDLSAVVSKWVGETQKHLQQLFNAADDSNGILFFDEADALFGKRSEVQHSQDRWANMEINFLLQRLESYRGLAILATNMKNALDPAFLRRLRFIVNFSFPGAAERKRIWMGAFPPKIDTSGLDFDRLSKLAIAGAGVHNIALSAAFLAADRGTGVTMPIVLEAARTEMKKIDKPYNELDFSWSEAPRIARVVEMKR